MVSSPFGVLNARLYRISPVKTSTDNLKPPPPRYRQIHLLNTQLTKHVAYTTRSFIKRSGSIGLNKCNGLYGVSACIQNANGSRQPLIGKRTMKKFYTPILAGIFALGISTASVTPAEARRGGGRLAASIILGVVAGAIIYDAHRRDRKRYRRHRRRHVHGLRARNVGCRYPTSRWHGHRAWGGEGHRHRHCGRHYH